MQGQEPRDEASGIEAVELLLTARCNLACTYCYQGRRPGKPMTWEVAEAALDLVLDSAAEHVSVALGGGEPLLELALMRRVVAHVRDRRPEVDATTVITSTNGTLLDESAATFLVENDIETQLSFDGVAAAQDRRRSGSFATLDEVLRRLLQHHPEWVQRRLAVSLTVTAHNLRFLADSVGYFLATGVRRLSLSPAITHQAEWSPGRIGEMKAQLEQVSEMVIDHQSTTGIQPLTDLKPRRGRDLGEAMCRVGRCRGLTVDWEGRLYGCASIVEPLLGPDTELLRHSLGPLWIGTLSKPDLEGRLHRFADRAAVSPLFSGRSRKWSAYDRCQDCEVAAECVICPTAIGRWPGNSNSDRIPDFLCAFQRVTADVRRRMPPPVDPFASQLLGEANPARRRVLEFAAAWSRRR